MTQVDAQAHLGATPGGLPVYVRALRPHQWAKNSLIFLPMLAAHAFTFEVFLASFLAFASFSLVASSAYVLNDLMDIEADRAHPRKCRRPFASGAIPKAHGPWMAGVLFLAGLSLAAIGGAMLFWVVLAYALITCSYSLTLKRQMVLDICVLAGLYTMRIWAGGAATGLHLSVWMLAFSIFMFFALAAVKRQAELVDMSGRGKLAASGRGYTVGDMPIVAMMAIGSGYMSILVLALYIDTDQVQSAYRTPELLWGICGVLLFWVSRTVMLTHRGEMHDDPLVYAFKDRASAVSFCAMLGFAFAAIWV